MNGPPRQDPCLAAQIETRIDIPHNREDLDSRNKTKSNDLSDYNQLAHKRSADDFPRFSFEREA